MVEVMSFANSFSLAMEQVEIGMGSRLAQAGGLDLEFNSAARKIYMNIDGEFFKLMRPARIQIERKTVTRMLYPG